MATVSVNRARRFDFTLQDGNTERIVSEVGDDDAVVVEFSGDAQPYDVDMEWGNQRPTDGQVDDAQYSPAVANGPVTFEDTKSHTVGTVKTGKWVLITVTNNSGEEISVSGDVRTHPPSGPGSAGGFAMKEAAGRPSVAGQSFIDGGMSGQGGAATPDDFHNRVMVTEEGDLPPVSGGTHTLADDTAYVIVGTVNYATEIEYGTNSGLYGMNWPSDQLNYTGSGTAISASENAVFMRNLVVQAMTGTVFDVSGTSNDRFLVQACAFINCDTLGTVDGFQVPGFKLCDFTNFNTGLTMTGNPNKIFWTATVMREASSATAIEFDADFQSDYVQLVDIFFKQFNNNSDAIKFDTNATLNQDGIVRSCMFDTTVQNRTVDFDETTKGWNFESNTGIQDSSVRGQYDLDSATETTITTQAANEDDGADYVRVAGTTTARSGIERFTHSDNQLTYDSVKDRDLSFDVTISIDGVNDTIAVAFFKNGTLVDGSAMRVTGTGNATVNIQTFAEVNLTDGDTMDVRLANLDAANNINVTDMIVRGHD